MRAAAALLLIAVMSFACTPSRSTPAATDRHVFIIVMENHTPEQALSGPFMASLASKYALAENYHAITHPSVPNYLALTSGSTWGVTDDCHNTHSCEIAVGDEWLRGEVAQITASKAFQSDGVLFVTYDEDDRASDNRVLTIVVTPHGSHRTSSRSYTHYSMLATIEDLLGVGRLGQAKSASPMTDL